MVPASLGLAFGVKAQLFPGRDVPFAQMRVYQPGKATPEVWESGFNDLAPSLAFFRFDTEAELIPGLWRFEAWEGETRLYSVEFEVVLAATQPEIAQACGAVS